MSKFNGSSAFFKRNTYQLDIKSISSQKEQRQQKKNKKVSNYKTDTVSDDEFNKLMEQNENTNTNMIRLSDYLSKIKDSEIAIRLIQQQMLGTDLLEMACLQDITGSQLLKQILNKYNDPNNYNWIYSNQYGLLLQFLLRENPKEQLLCLLLIQNYSSLLGFPKINYKDKSIYFIKIIFQLLFTNDIIDESSYLEWQEILIEFTDLDDKVKNTITIQTAEFMNIFKKTFTDQDYEENNSENTKEENKQESKLEKINSDNEQSNKSDDELYKIIVPVEQDYNMDDDNFNLDDL
jgi:hypothetical protein